MTSAPPDPETALRMLDEACACHYADYECEIVACKCRGGLAMCLWPGHAAARALARAVFVETLWRAERQVGYSHDKESIRVLPIPTYLKEPRDAD